MSDTRSSAKSTPKEEEGPAVTAAQVGEGRRIICATGDGEIEKKEARAVPEVFAAHSEPSTSSIRMKDDWEPQTKGPPKEATKGAATCRPEVFSGGEPIHPSISEHHEKDAHKKATVTSDSDPPTSGGIPPNVEREETRERTPHLPSTDICPPEETTRPETSPEDDALVEPLPRQESAGLPVATPLVIAPATRMPSNAEEESMLTPAKDEEEGCCVLTLPCCDCQVLVPHVRITKIRIVVLLAVVLAIIMAALAGTGIISIDRRIKFCEVQKLLPSIGSNNTGALFGSDIDIDGNTLVISSILSPLRRRAYVFTRATNATNATWELQAKLVPTDLDARAARDDKHSVAVEGNTVVLGLSGEYDEPLNYSGSVFVFSRNGTEWKQQAKLQPENGTYPIDAFGYSVAVSKGTIVVGAHKKDNRQGCVYVFAQTHANGMWTQQQKIQPADGTIDDEFGFDVDIQGDTIAIGARDDDNDENGKNSGSVYIYTRTDLNWTFQDKLIPSDGDESDYFGNAVSLDRDEDTVIIGCYSDRDDESDRDRGYRTGSAYVFTREGAKWTQQGPKLLASDGKTGNRFGASVDIDGDRAIIGASHYPGNNVDIGSAYVFERAGGKWTEQRKVVPLGGAANDYFGAAVAMDVDGDTIFVASPGDDVRGQDSGSTYLFNQC